MSLINFVPPTYNAVAAVFGAAVVDTIICQKLGDIVYKNIEIDFVSRAITECRDQINRKFSKFKLSALHLAAIKGWVDIATILVDKGAVVNSRDYNQFTPLHHAALTGNQPMISFLKSRGASESAKNSHGGTYQDIQRLTRQVIDVALSAGNLGTSIITNLSPDFNPTCFKPNVTLVTENVIEPQELVNRWETISSNTDSSRSVLKSIQPALRQAYAKYKANPPKLIVDHITQNDAGVPLLIPSNPCGVFAAQTIQPGEIIREYIGQVVSEAPQDITYLLGDIDGGRFRNEGAMMNDAFPNCFVRYIYDVNGIEERAVIIALEHIQPGQEITWNYQIHDNTKFLGHKELRPKALKEFLAKYSWKELIVSYKELFSNPTNMKSFVKSNRLHESINYIFNTPSTFLSLIEDGTIDQKVMKVLKSELGFWGSTAVGSWIIHMDKVLDIKVLIGKVSPEFSRQVVAQYRDAFPLATGGTHLAELQAIAYSALKKLVDDFIKIKHKVNKDGNLDKTEANRLLTKLRADFQKRTFLNHIEATNYIKREWNI